MVFSSHLFKSMSYCIDVYRGDAPPTSNFIDFSCFEALFPDLVAGPIIRYGMLEQQMRSRVHTSDKFARGIALFALGLAEKILIANPLGLMADAAFGAAARQALDAWAGLLAYSLQIYFDFSGYSDMAVGLGLMFGFLFIKNFDALYHLGAPIDWIARNDAGAHATREMLIAQLAQGRNRLAGKRRRHLAVRRPRTDARGLDDWLDDVDSQSPAEKRTVSVRNSAPLSPIHPRGHSRGAKQQRMQQPRFCRIIRQRTTAVAAGAAGNHGLSHRALVRPREAVKELRFRRLIMKAATACLLAVALAAATVPAAELWIGAATTSITPDQPVALDGHRGLRISNKVESPVTADGPGPGIARRRQGARSGHHRVVRPGGHPRRASWRRSATR